MGVRRGRGRAVVSAETAGAMTRAPWYGWDRPMDDPMQRARGLRPGLGLWFEVGRGDVARQDRLSLSQRSGSHGRVRPRLEPPFADGAARGAFGHAGARSSVAFADPARAVAVAVVFNGKPPTDAAHYDRARRVVRAIYDDLRAAAPAAVAPAAAAPAARAPRAEEEEEASLGGGAPHDHSDAAADPGEDADGRPHSAAAVERASVGDRAFLSSALSSRHCSGGAVPELASELAPV